MSKKIKEFELAILRQSFAGVKDVVLLEPLKVDASTDYAFRKQLRDAKVKCQMVRNTMARKVLMENGVADLGKAWSGVTLVCWGGESVKGLATAVDTAVKESRKDPKQPEKYKVKTAVADGQALSLDVAKTLPTRLEAIADVLGALLGPGASLAAALTGPGATVASLLQAIEDKGEKTETTTDAPAA
ncbi:MAG: 50S ribosomal protein L10 [Gemmataceae bacterium]